jgi:hypothetical protein
VPHIPIVVRLIQSSARPVTAGALVLLAGFPGEDTLAAYSFGLVDLWLRAHVAFPAAAGRRP